MAFNPSTRMTLAERVGMFRTMVQRRLSLEDLCEIFEASTEDLRMFVKMNAPDLSVAFESIVETAKAAVQQRSWHAHRRRRRPPPASSPVAPEGVRTGSKEQFLEDFIYGEVRFSEEDRPFNRLSEDDQEDIRVKTANFMDVHERMPKRRRAR